jgi:hypothetical protein
VITGVTSHVLQVGLLLRDYIVSQLKAGVTMATIHQRLADERSRRRRSRRCVGMWRRTYRKRAAGRRCAYCARAARAQTGSAGLLRPAGPVG